jgi:hypothetical protein
MRKEFLLFGLLSIIIVISGCIQQTKPVVWNTTHTISGTQELVLNEQDLQQLGVMSDGINCNTEEYETNEHTPLAQYSICNFTMNSLNDTEVVLELKKFTNLEDLNGSYQYDSLHLYSIEGLISENDYGDQSRFRVNNEHDYGGQYNEPNVYYYHLWICKNEYLIHITSKGIKEAEEYIAKIGRRILSKFG